MYSLTLSSIKIVFFSDFTVSTKGFHSLNQAQKLILVQLQKSHLEAV